MGRRGRRCDGGTDDGWRGNAGDGELTRSDPASCLAAMELRLENARSARTLYIDEPGKECGGRIAARQTRPPILQLRNSPHSAYRRDRRVIRVENWRES